MNPALLAIAPWAVGPSLSAHRVAPSVQLEVGGTVGLGEPLSPGGRAAIAVAPTRWAWFEVGGTAGSAVALCPDCGTRNLEVRTRLRVVDTDVFGLAVWGSGATTGRVVEGLAGVAAEGGTERFRIDASSPIVSSWFLLTTLRAGPELGVSARWSEGHATRVSVVGVEPGFGFEHRARLSERVQVGGTLRLGEEGARFGLNLRVGAPLGSG
ncbi:MAG: hypothetical protein AAF211_02285 [Myxococcota bacterium]